MNIISNCCLVGDLCEVKHIQYFTPFVWNSLFPDAIKTIIEHYNEIDFTHVELCRKDRYLGVNIDDKLKCYYIHYLWAPHEQLIRNKITKEVKGRHIFEYVLDSYNRRLARLNIKEKPKFLFITNRKAHADILGRNETPEEWQEIIDLLKKHDYKAIVFTKFNNLRGNENVKIVKITDDNPRVTLEQNLILVNDFIKEDK